MSVLRYINQFSSPEFDTLFVVITQLGGFVAVPIIAAGVGAILLLRRQFTRALTLFIGVGGAAVLNVILKLVFERPRPDLWEQLVLETSYSFPSGHAMASFALAASLVVILWNTRWRLPVVALGSLYVILVGFSRLYLGVHYPSDIVAGWLVSLAWVVLVQYFIGLSLRRKIARTKR